MKISTVNDVGEGINSYVTEGEEKRERNDS